jgi:hypothetical protein
VAPDETKEALFTLEAFFAPLLEQVVEHEDLADLLEDTVASVALTARTAEVVEVVEAFLAPFVEQPEPSQAKA